jgi:hypothetical protein
MWCDIVLQFSGGDSFNPPPRPLPQSMGGTLSVSNCAEFDLALDKKVLRAKCTRTSAFNLKFFVQGEELYGGLKAIRAQIACETKTAACVGPTCLRRHIYLILHRPCSGDIALDRFLRFIAHHKPSTLLEVCVMSCLPLCG